jgi:hypothetical protein
MFAPASFIPACFLDEEGTAGMSFCQLDMFPAAPDAQLAQLDLLERMLPPLVRIEDEAIAAWNMVARHNAMATVDLVTSTIYARLEIALIDCGGLDGWRRALAAFESNPFYFGANKRGWCADLDFFARHAGTFSCVAGAN